MINETTTGGGGEQPGKGPEITTYDEKTEQDIARIIASCTVKVTDKDGFTSYIIGDLSILTIELLEYIISLKKKND